MATHRGYDPSCRRCAATVCASNLPRSIERALQEVGGHLNVACAGARTHQDLTPVSGTAQRSTAARARTSIIVHPGRRALEDVGQKRQTACVAKGGGRQPGLVVGLKGTPPTARTLTGSMPAPRPRALAQSSRSGPKLSGIALQIRVGRLRQREGGATHVETITPASVRRSTPLGSRRAGQRRAPAEAACRAPASPGG